MNTVRKILEFILITLIFYALYSLSLSLHTHYFEKEDPALFVFASFLLSFLLILFYRFTISHGVKRRVREEVHQIYKTKEEKMRALAEASSANKGEANPHPDEFERRGEENTYDDEKETNE